MIIKIYYYLIVPSQLIWPSWRMAQRYGSSSITAQNVTSSDSPKWWKTIVLVSKNLKPHLGYSSLWRRAESAFESLDVPLKAEQSKIIIAYWLNFENTRLSSIASRWLAKRGRMSPSGFSAHPTVECSLSSLWIRTYLIFTLNIEEEYVHTSDERPG